MRLMAFTVRDEKAEAYLRPFFADARGAGIRAFSDAVKDEQSPFFKHPGDYTLFEIGWFDGITGTLTPHIALVNLGNATEYVVEGSKVYEQMRIAQ